MLTFICYPQCPTCQRVKALLDSRQIEYAVRDIRTDNPTYDELKSWLVLSKLPVIKFFNTGGHAYHSLGLKHKLSGLNEDRCLKLLATDGRLVKHPLLVDDERVWVSFNQGEWKSVLTDTASVPDTMTIEMTNSNNIEFPFEWFLKCDCGHKFVQITFADDKIIIQKPTAAGVEYTRPCKADENNYICSAGLSCVRVPKQLFKALAVKFGDKLNLTLEENRISIRRCSDEPIIAAVEPIIELCCVCGRFLYTENSLVKVTFSKYICRDCIELVKLLP